jgi:CRISPR-associated protein (TIGR02584 family)
MKKTTKKQTPVADAATESTGSQSPYDYSRRVLVMAVGLTPQVLTETLYALAVEAQKPWVPTEIHLITTSEGEHRARLSLLHDAGGQFHRFCADYGLQGMAFDASHIHVVEDEQGRPIQDMRTVPENTRAADDICTRIGALCNDPNSSVHASIAGGRKTMGYYLGYALSLFGREQDRLSHVLVNAPFESLPDFFYPPVRPQVLHDRTGRPANTADARIMLAEIPFVRLRDGLPQDILSGDRSFALAVAAANDQARPRIVLLRDRCSLRFGKGPHQKDVKLPPREWAWYAMFCQARVEGWGQAGLLDLDDVELAVLERNYGWVNRRVLNEKRSKPFGKVLHEMKTQGERITMSGVIAKANALISKALGGQAAMYHIASVRQGSKTFNGLKDIPPEAIQLPPMR